MKLLTYPCLVGGIPLYSWMPSDLIGAIPPFCFWCVHVFFFPSSFIGCAIYFTCWWLTNNHSLRKTACAKLLSEDTWRDLSVIPVKEPGEKEETESVEMGSVRWWQTICSSMWLFFNTSDFLVKLLNFQSVDGSGFCGKCQRTSALIRSSTDKI